MYLVTSMESQMGTSPRGLQSTEDVAMLNVQHDQRKKDRSARESQLRSMMTTEAGRYTIVRRWNEIHGIPEGSDSAIGISGSAMIEDILRFEYPA